jgi:hypothetical protein
MGKCIFNRTKEELKRGVCRFYSAICDARYQNEVITKTDTKIVENQKK